MKFTDEELARAQAAYWQKASVLPHRHGIIAALESLEGVYLSQRDAEVLRVVATDNHSALHPDHRAIVAIDVQLTPPTPEPQKFGAVVRDANGRLYSHDGTTDDNPWYCRDGDRWLAWEGIAQPVTIEFEGVDE